jgi:signal transduction histidine kinase
VIQVADDGIGITQENLDKVFNPFFSTRSDGLGLGLFVTQQIVHRYGGSIRVASSPQEGTLFEVKLPSGGEGSQNGSIPLGSEKGGRETHDSAVSRR